MPRFNARLLTVGGLVLTALVLGACGKPPVQPGKTAQAPPIFHPDAGIQDIMASMIDPAADFLWESVKTDVTSSQTIEKRPTTDAEWLEVRRNAIIVAEASNLLMIEGRKVAREGRLLEDHGVEGNLSADQAQAAIAANRADFLAHATALHDVGEGFVAAAEARDTKAMINVGEAMDQVCESCHLQFWYPSQKIPDFRDDLAVDQSKKRS